MPTQDFRTIAIEDLADVAGGKQDTTALTAALDSIKSSLSSLQEARSGSANSGLMQMLPMLALARRNSGGGCNCG